MVAVISSFTSVRAPEDGRVIQSPKEQDVRQVTDSKLERLFTTHRDAIAEMVRLPEGDLKIRCTRTFYNIDSEGNPYVEYDIATPICVFLRIYSEVPPSGRDIIDLREMLPFL